MSAQPDGPIYLTAAGRRRLEARVAEYTAQLAGWRSSEANQPAVDDRGDAAERLIEADDLAPARDFLARTQAVLERAVAMPEGPDDGIVRLGSTVTVRDGEGESTFMLVDPAEVENDGTRVAADSPLGRALLGHARGDQVAVDAPAGRRVLTLQAVAPYRERAR
ncbi:MAG TPA: GreA/GreB family elongation factor [Chloroflexota bacterium]|jgi:transcription elongation factor GreA